MATTVIITIAAMIIPNMIIPNMIIPNMIIPNMIVPKTRATETAAPETMPTGPDPDQRPAGGAANGLDPAGLMRLLAWLSPAFPTGAFSYSHGLEQSVADGLVTNRETLVPWVQTVIRNGTGRIDATLFVAAHKAASAGDRAALLDVAELAAAHHATAELALESTAQGAAFLTAVQAAWPCGAVAALATAWDGPLALPVAVGVAAAGHGLAVQAALTGYLHAIAANLIGAGVRLIPLGQTDGLLALAALEAPIFQAVDAAIDRPLADLGGASPLVDWASAAHENLYARLFRS